MKICVRCKQEKNDEEFRWQSKASFIRSYACKPCLSKSEKITREKSIEDRRRKDREKYYKNREKILERKENFIGDRPDYNRIRNLRVKYKITIKQYNYILEEQNNSCAICSRHKSTKNQSMCVDYDDENKTVRGIICDGCNRRVKNYIRHKDEIEFYLKKENNHGL